MEIERGIILLIKKDGKREGKKGKFRTVIGYNPSSGTVLPKAEVICKFKDPKRLGPAELYEVGMGGDPKGLYLRGRGGVKQVKASSKIRTTGEIEIDDIDLNIKRNKKRSRRK